MTSEQFAYWLQGFVELHGSEPTAEQWKQIKDHLQLVFVKVTPSVVVTGPVTTQEDRPGKSLEDALREIGRTGTGQPLYPGLQRTVIC